MRIVLALVITAFGCGGDDGGGGTGSDAAVDSPAGSIDAAIDAPFNPRCSDLPSTILVNMTLTTQAIAAPGQFEIGIAINQMFGANAIFGSLRLLGNQGAFAGGPPHTGTFATEVLGSCGVCAGMLIGSVTPLPAYRVVGNVTITAVSATMVMADLPSATLVWNDDGGGSPVGPYNGCPIALTYRSP